MYLVTAPEGRRRPRLGGGSLTVYWYAWVGLWSERGRCGMVGGGGSMNGVQSY